jgi:glucosamine--fructose-6-phosphate aminotransferase (isomerizing)
MVVGIGDGETFFASDLPPLLSHTRKALFLEDGEMVVARPEGVRLTDFAGNLKHRAPQHIDWSPVMAEKGGYRHFMLKEIHEQPRAILDTLAGRILPESGRSSSRPCRFRTSGSGPWKKCSSSPAGPPGTRGWSASS